MGIVKLINLISMDFYGMKIFERFTLPLGLLNYCSTMGLFRYFSL